MNTKSTELSFAIIGAGMAGMLAAIKLRKSGYKNVTIFEKADDVGGTWRENTYPGLTCDVPSHSYTYSFSPNPSWSHYLAPGPEIQKYFKGIADRYNLKEIIKFNEEIISCAFNGVQWHLKSNTGTELLADFVIAATGVLHFPNTPPIAGQESFSGHIFHSARWDHSVKLDGKKIGIIGNGSTGVQLVSALASRVKKLCHFQRTPQWIMPVENPAYSEDEMQAFRDDPKLLYDKQNDKELDKNIEMFSEAIVNPDSDAMHQIEAYVAANLEANINDPELKAKLTPEYRAACKRLIYSPDYYQAIQHKNSQLISNGIVAIENGGIRTDDDVLHDLDIIVFATGFKADQFMRPMEVKGRKGIALNDVWEETPSAYLAVSIPEFPNFFMLNGPNGPVGNFSLIEIAELQWHYIEQLITEVNAGQCDQISASQNAYRDFNIARIEAAKTTVFGTGCKSWYLDANGVPATWPWSRARFAELMQKPKLGDFDLI